MKCWLLFVCQLTAGEFKWSEKHSCDDKHRSEPSRWDSQSHAHHDIMRCMKQKHAQLHGFTAQSENKICILSRGGDRGGGLLRLTPGEEKQILSRYTDKPRALSGSVTPGSDCQAQQPSEATMSPLLHGRHSYLSDNELSAKVDLPSATPSL